MTDWTRPDPANPPATHMVAIYSDGCGAQTISKFDNTGFLLSEDGFELSPADVLDAFSWWMPAPPDFVPHFMELTGD